MTRIILSSLAFAAMLSAGALSPASAETLKSDQQPTSCDCSNCSAEHCQGTGGGGGTFTITFGGTLGSSNSPKTQDLKAPDKRN